MEAEVVGGFVEVFEDALAVSFFVLFEALADVEFTVFDESIDESGQFVGGGGNGRRGA